MPCLLYCIMTAPVAGGGPLTGVSGRPVSFVTAAGLGAAVAEVATVAHAPPVSELLAYGRVVAELYQRQPVIPMRYGGVLADRPAVRRLLEERRQPYAALLQELAGCCEMGIRIKLSEPVAAAAPAAPVTDGGGYLARRQAHYRRQEEHAQQHQALLTCYIQAFAGLYRQHRTETATRDGGVVLSLFFLVPKDQATSFRETFQRVVEPEGATTLISGPWPPYTFATRFTSHSNP
jgi:hypothetical protein